MVINIKGGEMQVYHNSLRNDEPMLKASIGQPNKIAIPNFVNQTVNSYTIGEISNGVGVSKFTGHMKFRQKLPSQPCGGGDVKNKIH